MSAVLSRAERDAEPGPERSLQGDLRGLFEDGRSYAEAEVAFQKTRVTYVVGQVPKIAIYGVLAFLFVFFALGGLVVGLIIALAPLLTAWGSMAAVCITLVIGAVVCLLAARAKWRAIVSAFSDEADA
jgi:uncharacterized membrane protein YqjE